MWGARFPILLHKNALKLAKPRQLLWIYVELFANALWIALVLAVLGLPELESHIAAMASGHCLTAFFARWTVHHDCGGSDRSARTLRNRFKSLIAFNMFFHAEHHLYPKVPTCHLPVLANRLDKLVPELELKQVY